MSSTAVLGTIGFLLIGAVGFQLALVIWSYLRQTAWQHEAEQLSRRLLQERIDAAKALRARQETARFAWNGFRKFVIDRKVHEAENVCSFYLTPHDRKSLPSFQPGQFLTFQLRVPDQEKAVVRCYSLSNGPKTQQDFYRVTIKRCLPPPKARDAPPGVGSGFFHDHIREGDILDVRAPTGKFVLDPLATKPAVLLGAGVGITPLFSMLSAIADTNSPRETWLFYGVRHAGEHALRDEIHALEKRHENLHVVTCYSHPRPEDVAGEDYQHQGWVSVDLLKEKLPNSNYEFFICGPPPMMDSLKQGLAAWGVPQQDVRTEAFGPASVPKPAAAKPPAGDALTIKFAKSNKEVPWDGTAQNLLDLAESAGADVQGGCRAGNCGTCEIAVLSGEVEYSRDPEYPDLKEGCCLTCIGVPKVNLILDA